MQTSHRESPLNFLSQKSVSAAILLTAFYSEPMGTQQQLTRHWVGLADAKYDHKNMQHSQAAVSWHEYPH